MSAHSEIDIEATPEEVWEAVATEAGRREWLDDPRDVTVEAVEAPNRLVWWWQDGDELTRVEITILPAGSGSRVAVTESVPGAFPLPTLAAALAAPVAA